MARDVDEITGIIVDAAFKIHVGLGPGLLESVYEAVLERELERRGLKVERQKIVSFEFDGMHFDDVLRLDLFVESLIVVELKSVEHWRRFTRSKSLPIYDCSSSRSAFSLISARRR